MKSMILGTAATALIGASAYLALAAGHADPATMTCADYLAMDDATKAEAFEVVKAAVLDAGGVEADMPATDATCAANPEALVTDAMNASG